MELRPEPRPRHDPDAREQALFEATATYPGLFFIDAHQQSSGYFFPPNEDAALHEISHFALDVIKNVIGPSIQEQFNDQTAQYRNYNTYDLFVPEYGDTVPALLMGGAGMTYEKGTNENYGKQVYDHYLAMDETVNAIAAKKTELMDGWVRQWQEAVDQGASCKLQDNTQVSPPAIDLLDIGQARATRTRTWTSAATTSCRTSTRVTSPRRSGSCSGSA